MFKYKYFVTYTVRPNKKTIGSYSALNMTTSGRLESQKEQLKIYATLARIHCVNPDAIINVGFKLRSREFVPLKWVKDKLVSMINSIRDSGMFKVRF